MTAPDGENSNGQGSTSLSFIWRRRKQKTGEKCGLCRKITLMLASLHHHISPRCFFCVPTAFAIPGTRSPEQMLGEGTQESLITSRGSQLPSWQSSSWASWRPPAHMSIIWRYITGVWNNTLSAQSAPFSDCSSFLTPSTVSVSRIPPMEGDGTTTTFPTASCPEGPWSQLMDVHELILLHYSPRRTAASLSLYFQCWNPKSFSNQLMVPATLPQRLPFCCWGHWPQSQWRGGWIPFPAWLSVLTSDSFYKSQTACLFTGGYKAGFNTRQREHTKALACSTAMFFFSNSANVLTGGWPCLLAQPPKDGPCSAIISIPDFTSHPTSASCQDDDWGPPTHLQ